MSLERTLAALRATLDADPRNGALWLHYAELCAADGRAAEELAALRSAAELSEVRADALRRLVPALREAGQLAEALIRAEGALEAGEDPELRAELERIEALRADPSATDDTPAGSGTTESAPRPAEPAPPAEPLAAAEHDTAEPDDDWAAQFDWGDLVVRMDDVAGLEDVKRQVHLRIVAPFTNPEIYKAFSRSAGGGILLYGPPGCGKTYLARAIAGELRAKFMSVSLHDILDKYYGETEKMVHRLFEEARRLTPTVLFFDEFDALGSSRSSGASNFWKSLVNALLAELDGVGQRNSDVLICAATNLPWNVDVAFRRPGRFDRVLFVPPPDRDSRTAILRAHLEQYPGGAQLDVGGVAKSTEGFSGADLRGIAERTAERAIDRSLKSGKVHEVQPADLAQAAGQAKSSIVEWFATARNHARYSNEGGQFDELADYLRSIKRW